jgi:uncharacterized protein YxeA
MKKIIITLTLLIILPVAYYLISPIFKVVELEEKSPLANIKGSMNNMDAATKQEFDRQVEAMKNQISVMGDKMPSAAKLISESDFKPRAHEVEGKAALIGQQGKKILRFEDFDTINGPNLHVYLSSGLGNEDFIDLGKLKATKGSFNYDLEKSIDTDRYNKVLVWCVPFGVLFSYAELG